MLDIKRIKENPEGVKAALHAKEVDCDAAIDKILALDEERRALIASTESRKAQQNKVSKEIPLLKKQGKEGLLQPRESPVGIWERPTHGDAAFSREMEPLPT